MAKTFLGTFIRWKEFRSREVWVTNMNDLRENGPAGMCIQVRYSLKGSDEHELRDTMGKDLWTKSENWCR